MTDTDNIKDIEQAVEETAPEAAKAAESDGYEKEEHKHKKNAEKERLKKDFEELKTKLEAAGTELADAKDRFLRTAAEYDNYRKRTDREKQQSVSFGVSSAVEKLLPAIDTLEIAAAADSSDAEYKKGVELTVSLFKTALESLGVKEMDVEGKPFDPNFHAAVMREAVEGVESGTVVKVLQKGYMLGDRVLRCAVVSVAE